MQGLSDAAALIFFVACGVSRWAFFHLTAEALEDGPTGSVPYFEVPSIVTGLARVRVLSIAWRQGAVGEDLRVGVRPIAPGRFHTLALVFVVHGSPMVSTRIRIPKP